VSYGHKGRVDVALITASSVVGYSRLVMYSFAFQQAFARGVTASDNVVFTKVSYFVAFPHGIANMGLQCLESAKTVVETFTNRLAPSGYMRFSPDGWFLVASFASAFLFKVLHLILVHSQLQK
jgi:hypothetical protein